MGVKNLKIILWSGIFEKIIKLFGLKKIFQIYIWLVKKSLFEQKGKKKYL